MGQVGEVHQRLEDLEDLEGLEDEQLVHQEALGVQVDRAVLEAQVVLEGELRERLVDQEDQVVLEGELQERLVDQEDQEVQAVLEVAQAIAWADREGPEGEAVL